MKQTIEDKLVSKVSKGKLKTIHVSREEMADLVDQHFIQNAETVEEFALEMQQRGILIELDDFGTGYSNIVSVMNTPLDTVKLDKSLVWSAMEKKETAAMVKSLSTVFTRWGSRFLRREWRMPSRRRL